VSNIRTGPVWKIDTPGVLTTKQVRVTGVSWISKNAVAGHDATLMDADCNTMWASVASGANYKESDSIDAQTPWTGLSCYEIDSGYLLIEFDWPEEP
jgi:hypothetical protein